MNPNNKNGSKYGKPPQKTKTGHELRCLGMVSCSCSTSGTRLVRNVVMNDERRGFWLRQTEHIRDHYDIYILLRLNRSRWWPYNFRSDDNLVPETPIILFSLSQFNHYDYLVFLNRQIQAENITDNVSMRNEMEYLLKLCIQKSR